MPLTLTRQEIQKKLAQAFDREQTASLVDVLDSFREAELERAADTRELKEGLVTLTQEVRKLTTAQQRTDARLAEHQVRTEEQFSRLDGLFAELVTAQQRTEGQLEELAVAQQRTNEQLAELVAAQQRTDGRVERLSLTVENLSVSVGTLANAFGFTLEEFTAALLPPYLERYFGISGVELRQQSFEMGGEEVEEVDLVGEGQRDGLPVLVLVECRAKVGGGETRRLSRKLARVAALNSEIPAVPIIVAMNIHPTARATAEETGVLLLPYSRINRDRG